ncbi:MAG TPA: class II glutamine amidotransferase [Anaeromyxobacteraceae bacterium]|nr:class II glutamine amidotransferase [Anaeromyxobacteraceae bacterium]
MGALIAILQNDPNLLACQVTRLRRQLVLAEGGEPLELCGWGYHRSGEVLVGRRPTGAPRPLELPDLVGPVSGEALVVRAQSASGFPAKDENTQPFRFRRWLFAHVGGVEAWPDVKPRLLSTLPDFLRRPVAGDTDSEHVFALFLHYLRDAGALDDLDAPAETVGRALARTVRQVDAWSREAGSQRPSDLALAVTNGRMLAAVRRGRPMHYALLEGIVPCPLHGIDASTRDSDPRLRPHRQAKAVVLATVLAEPSGFLEVPEGAILTVDRSLRLHIAPMNSH